MLFAYWDTLRGERAAPERRDLSPGAMRHILADTFILALDASRRASFRLAGTRCCALFGRDLKGVALSGLWSDDERAEADRLVELAVGDTVGLVVGLVGANENGSEIALEMLLLPLRHAGRTEARLVGSLSPGAVPSWAGLVPVRSLEIRSLRVIQAPHPVGYPARDLTAAHERRRLFVVHEGGRA